MKRNYVLTYGAETANEPIVWRLVKDFDLRVNILRAEISPGQEGNLLVEIGVDDEASLERALAWLGSIGVGYSGVAKRIAWDEDRCVDCGACTGVCFSGALAMDRSDWSLVVDRDLCTACGLCVTACPFRCFKLDFGD